jgi:hypothetical protein
MEIYKVGEKVKLCLSYITLPENCPPRGSELYYWLINVAEKDPYKLYEVSDNDVKCDAEEYRYKLKGVDVPGAVFSQHDLVPVERGKNLYFANDIGDWIDLNKFEWDKQSKSWIKKAQA